MHVEDSNESKQITADPFPNIPEVDWTISTENEKCLFQNSDANTTSSLKRSTPDSVAAGRSPKPTSEAQPQPRRNRNVQFSSVVVYHFAREQGFCSIPDNGWCSLGMSQRHTSVSRYDIHHHQLIQRLKRRRRRLSVDSSYPNGVLPARLRRKTKLQPPADAFYLTGDTCRVPVVGSPPLLSPQVSYDPSSLNCCDPVVQSTPPPPCLSPPSPRRVLSNLDEGLSNTWASMHPDCLVDTDSETSLDRMPTLQKPKTTRSDRSKQEKIMPMHAAARIRLLKESGVTHFDVSEREECVRIRANRSCVGCACGPRWPCLPERCSCARDGVQCQVDRISFPCSCVAECCRNPHGRNEFPAAQVRDHVRRIVNREKSSMICPATSVVEVSAPDIDSVTNHATTTTTDSDDISSSDRPTDGDGEPGRFQQQQQLDFVDHRLHVVSTPTAKSPLLQQKSDSSSYLATLSPQPGSLIPPVSMTTEADASDSNNTAAAEPSTTAASPYAFIVNNMVDSSMDQALSSDSPRRSPTASSSSSTRRRSRHPSQSQHWMSPSGIPLVFTWRQMTPRRRGGCVAGPSNDPSSPSPHADVSGGPSWFAADLFGQPNEIGRLTNSTPLRKARSMESRGAGSAVKRPGGLLSQPSPLALGSSSVKSAKGEATRGIADDDDGAAAEVDPPIAVPKSRVYEPFNNINMTLHTSISLGRLSLRRRAIPRFPVVTGCNTTPGPRRRSRQHLATPLRQSLEEASSVPTPLDLSLRRDPGPSTSSVDRKP